METLKVGSKGPFVLQWEHFLRGQGLLVDKEIDSTFTTATAEATKKFQQKHKLGADGIAGNKTIGLAMAQYGFAVLAATQDLPKRPPDAVPLKPADREKLLGKITYVAAPTPQNPEAIKITNDWQKENLGSVVIPQLKGVQGAGSKVFFHKKAIPQLVRLFERWEKEGLLDRILSWGGTWNPRFIRGSRTTLSNHAWATAFDCNVPWNGLGCRPALVGEKGSVRELVLIAYECGFFWGGHFGVNPDGSLIPGGRRDGMHFEVYKIV